MKRLGPVTFRSTHARMQRSNQQSHELARFVISYISLCYIEVDCRFRFSLLLKLIKLNKLSYLQQ